MQRKARIAAGAGIAVVVLGGAGAAVLAATTTDDVSTSITGPELDRAVAVALAHTGQGRVTGTEVGDEESYYEVEVTLDTGSQVDVQLDENFQVVSASADVENDTGEGDRD